MFQKKREKQKELSLELSIKVEATASAVIPNRPGNSPILTPVPFSGTPQSSGSRGVHFLGGGMEAPTSQNSLQVKYHGGVVCLSREGFRQPFPLSFLYKVAERWFWARRG